MTIIIEGITPTEYITAINDNFTALNVLTENLASLTTCTVNMLSGDLKTEIDNNNAALNVYPYVPKSLSVITIGTKGSVFASRLNANVISLETELNLVKKHVIGSYGCYGMPTITEDPLNPGKYIMIGQKFSGPLGTPLDDGDIYYSIFDLAAHSFTVPETVLDAASDTLYQGHAIWGYWNGKYHFAWAQSSTRALTDGTLVAIESATWQGFKNHVLLDVEPAITNELGWEPWFRFLSIDANTVWIVYSCHISGHIYVAYTIWDSVNGWDKVEHKITVTDVVSADETYAIGIGSFLKEGNNLFLYYLQKGLSTPKIMVVQSTDNGATWENPVEIAATNNGISTAPIVKKYNGVFYMVYNTLSYIKIQKSTDGITFTNEQALKICYSYPLDFIVINDNHILVTWPKRDDIGEGGEDTEADMNATVIYTGTYLTT